MNVLLTAALFLLPGSIVLTQKNFLPRLLLVEKIPIVLSLSLAYWVIGFWWLWLVPIPFHTFIFSSLGISVSILAVNVVRRRAERLHVRSFVQNGTVAIWFVVLAIPGLILINHSIAPSGADMTMHAYLAKIIYLADRFPNTMQPLLPTSQFGIYPVGFSVITAAMMFINGYPVHTNALWLSAFTYWFFAVSMYLLVRSRYSVYVSSVTTLLITWVSLTPNDFIEWGANPTILSLDFVIIACVCFLHLKQRTMPLFLLICAYAALLTHYIIPTGLAYTTLFLSPIVWRHISPVKSFRTSFTSAAFIVASLSIPFILHLTQLSWPVSLVAKTFVFDLQQQELVEWTHAVNRIPLIQAMSFLTGIIGSQIMYLYGLSLLLLLLIRKHSVWRYVAWTISILLLIMNAKYWLLPLSELLYPKRVGLLLLLPIAQCIAQGLSSTLDIIYTQFVIHSRRNRVILHGLILLFVLYAYSPRVLMHIRRFINSNALSTLTKEDIDAMHWLSTHTSEQDIILNNYSDAGLWIPAIADRQITLYHTNPFDMSVLTYNRGKETYAFVGNKSLSANPQTDEVSVFHLEQDPSRYNLVYQNGNARIYKVIATPNPRH